MKRTLMLNPKYVLSVALVVVLLSASLVPVALSRSVDAAPAARPALATTRTVCASGCMYTSIQAAIDAATNGDIIDIANGTYTNGATVNKNLTIQGQGASTTLIQGSSGYRVFTVATNVSVTFKDLTMRNSNSGSQGNQGGGLSVNTGSVVTLTTCIVNGNSAGTGAGIFVNTNATLNIITSTVSNNTNGSSWGGGLYVGSGGIVNVSGSTFSGNTAQGGDGRGGAISSEGGTLTISNSTFTNNKANVEGGGIQSYGSATLISNTFTSNTASNNGGAIFGRSMTVISNTFDSNSSYWGGGLYIDSGTATVVSSTFRSNSSVAWGGGLLSKGVLTVTASTFISNTATGNGSHAGGIDVHVGTLSLTNSTFTGNTAYQDGGGLFLNSGTSANVSGTTFSSNVANHGWGGAIRNAGPLTLTSSIVISNTAADNNTGGNGGGLASSSGRLTLDNTVFMGNIGAHDGGGLYVNDNVANISNSTFSGNRAVNYSGGALAVHGGTTTLVNSTVTDNKANTTGGGIRVANARLNMANTTVASNTITTNGGGIYVESGSTDISNSTLSGNSAQYGGALYSAPTGSSAITNSTLAGNSASGTGSGIYNWGTVHIKSSIVASQTTGVDCAVSGGAITSGGYNLESGTTCNFTQATDVRSANPLLGPVQNNGGQSDTRALLMGSPAIGKIPAGTNGCGIAPLNVDQRGMPRPLNGFCDIGAFQTPLTTLILSVNTTADEFGENRALCSLREAIQAANTDAGFGGCFPGSGADTIGLAANTYTLTRAGANENSNATGDLDITSPLTITGANKDTTLITANRLDRALHIQSGTVLITGVTIRNGQADLGGGLLISGGAGLINASQFITNTATTSGGGLYVNTGAVVAINTVTFNTNVAATDGGGLYVNSNATANLSAATFSGNIATSGSGGGVRNAGTLILNASTLTGNATSASSGGGLASTGTLTLTNDTFTGNTSNLNGGGLSVAGGVAAVDTSTLTGNTTKTGVGGGLYVGSGTVTFMDSAVYGNAAKTNGGGLSVNGGATTVRNSTFSNNTANQGGGVYASGGQLDIRFSTLNLNKTNTSQGAQLAGTVVITLGANILAQPQGGVNCFGTPPATTGYNRGSDGSCLPTAGTDVANATITLSPLAYNSGPTQNHLPVLNAGNSIIDVVPPVTCDQWLWANPTDQRGLPRPRQVFGSNYCDAGAIEVVRTGRTVCGPPLSVAATPDRCEYPSVAAALAQAMDDDVIIISGVITETITVTRSVTIRGPNPDESTPGTHLGIVQRALTTPASTGSPILTIAAGQRVVLQNLNIRNGYAASGSAISNAGALTLNGVTLYGNRAEGPTGSLIANSGSATLVITNSTLTGNTGTGALINNSVNTAGALAVNASTLVGAGSTLLRNTAALNTAFRVSNSIVTGTLTSQCVNVSSGDGNLYADCFASPQPTDRRGDPGLKPLRDNGGPTLTRDMAADSPAIGVAACTVAVDQRGRTRPAAHCTSGAVEYAPQTLTVCATCDADPAHRVYADLQLALNAAMAGDMLNLQAGVYTGNFIAYKDVTLQHAGLEVSTLSRERPVDVRAIVQASDQTVAEQHQLNTYAGTVLTVQGYAPISTTIVATNDVEVTLRGLTIQHGASQQGGGLYNLGTLHVYTSTIAANVAYNSPGRTAQGGGIYNAGTLWLDRSTVSGNQSEYYAGAIYNAGPAVQVGVSAAEIHLTASTLAANTASRLPNQRVVAVTDNGLSPATLTVTSGDEIRFENRTATSRSLNVAAVTGGACQPQQIAVPVMGAGLSSALTCTRNGVTGTALVTVTDSLNTNLTITITVQAVSFTPTAAVIYHTGNSQISAARSILFSATGSGQLCDKPVSQTNAVMTSGGYNVLSDNTCFPENAATDQLVDQPEVAGLGALQDNNTIDFGANRISGYTYSHALSPDSAAIDQIPPEACGLNAVHALDLGSLNRTLNLGEIVQWSNPNDTAVTLAFHDGEATVQLIDVPATGQSRQVQFGSIGTWPYTVYHAETRVILNTGTLSVLAAARSVDQRGAALPQRGPLGVYHCDVGAVEFAPWVVGQPLPRPPAAIGTEPPQWGVSDEAAYHAWSPATSLDYALRPSRDQAAPAHGKQPFTVQWNTSAEPATRVMLAQTGIVEWPDDPRLHISGAPVNFNPSSVADDFQATAARAFEGQDPQDDPAGQILSGSTFTRTILPTIPGDSYSVLQFAKGSQANVSLRVLVVQTVSWNAAGVRDMTPARSNCTIGTALSYPLHQDPEGKNGWVLSGDAYDGLRFEADLASAWNTVGNAILPAYIRETRVGPIIPILAAAPTLFANTDLVTGDHDLRIAWYQPDERNIAWPVKSVGYRCDWPDNPQHIVIASELGSEIDSQPALSADRFTNPAIYHQPDSAQPGYSPNYEHALLASSNLSSGASALYALRTDLFDRNTASGTSRSFVLLKYQDPNDGDQTKFSIYQVDLTRSAESLPTNSVTVRAGTGGLPTTDRFTVPVELWGAQNLRSATVSVAYDPATLAPTVCAPNQTQWMERPYGALDAATLQVDTDAPVQPGMVTHLRASLAAGTEVYYEWNFGDGLVQIDKASVSHVYGAMGNYTVIVTASNSLFSSVVTASVPITIAANVYPAALPVLNATGCRIGPNGTLTFEVMTHDKHGESGRLTLANVTFTRLTTATASLTPTLVSLASPAYEALSYDLTAGNPVYAPVPLQGLFNNQTCAQTQAADLTARPFWKDYRGKLWARAAGEMDVLYFYPLQTGFYLSDAQAVELGLTNPLSPTQALNAAQQVGRCVPWLNKSLSGTLPYPNFPMAGQTTQVLPVSYHVSWPALPALLSVGETVYQKAKSGLSGVATQQAVTRIYDDLAPGEWSSDAQQVVITGSEVITSLTQLIAPVDEVRVSLTSLPEDIQTERRLYGGGLAIAGNTTNINLALPFSLRSRVSYDDSTKELVFRGYYDGASPEYIKGDPLLLLNVMSQSDLARLKALCPTATASCTTYKSALDDLYWATLNPRQIDLCRDSSGRLSADDPEPDQGQLAKTTSMEMCDTAGVYYRDGQPDQGFLIGVQDADDDGVPEPYAGLGKGKALTAGNAAGTGYVTLVYNNDSSLGSLPVSLQVVKVGCEADVQGDDSPYRGNVLVIKSDNLFDEKLTLRHTGDFGGQPDNFNFEWYIAPVDETGISPLAQPPNYPWQKWTKIEPGAGAAGPEITIEGATPTTLSDNWLIMRYKGYAACGNTYRYSAFAGDPSAKPSEVKGQLAEGWIKRVTTALNPLDARVDDFVSTPINTTVSMIQEAGPRYEGPVAMSSDPDTLNAMGLIEAYQTVLERGRALSIDSGINDAGANAALLNVTTRIADLYALLANDAYVDALDPTVALGTTSSLGSRASAVFAFMNQFPATQFGPIDEELALLRGRDQTLGGVAAGPTYNRLTWNFTNGDGAVAYQQNYNVKDVNGDGFINEADAALMYPQGHGDAWGQFLTAVTKYYELLRHPNYTWSPRAEPVAVAGAPVVVDYYDEKRFAIAAANKARIGAEIVDLAYRKNYANPSSQPYLDTLIDTTDTCMQEASADCQQRAWGVADWAERAGEGALFDWVTANAVLPPTDDRYHDVRQIDRTTVTEIGEIADQYAAIQTKLDNADKGANPLGLAPDAVLFDLDPALTKTTPNQVGKTHFEQVYDRALESLANAVTTFNYANEMKIALRDSQNSQRNFVQKIVDEDRGRVNELIDILGTPYADDIGVNGTYPAGYQGPDIYNYDLVDRTEMTDREKRCSDQDRALGNCAKETKTFMAQYSQIGCLGFYVTYTTIDDFQGSSECLMAVTSTLTSTLPIQYIVGDGLDRGYGRFKPNSWSGSRAAEGEVQSALRAVYQARLEFEMAITAYDNHLDRLSNSEAAIRDRAELLDTKDNRKRTSMWTAIGMQSGLVTLKSIGRLAGAIYSQYKDVSVSVSECTPKVVGLDNDALSTIRCAIQTSGMFAGMPNRWLQLAKDTAADAGEAFNKILDKKSDLTLFEEDSDYELRQMVREFEPLVRQEQEYRLALLLAGDKVIAAQVHYNETLQKGLRKLSELSQMRARWAGQISEQRYGDMAYRIFQIDALQKYRQQFDMAQLYTFLTASAYDYDTNLASDDQANGSQFVRSIGNLRSLGAVQINTTGITPIVGNGLADPLARMKANFAVLKGQMGFNNPQSEANRFSVRKELFRLEDSSDAKWRQELQKHYTPNIYGNDAVARLAQRPYGETGAVPGLVIPIGTNIRDGLNFFGLPLGPGDSAYDASQFVTKIASAGIWFKNYDTTRLANTPRVYLLPAGKDVIRPRDASGELRYWNITEQLLPVPYPITPDDLANPDWLARVDGLNGQLFASKPYARLRAYPYSPNLVPDELNTDTRLIGRSVWNTQWLLVIPGSTLLADPGVGIERFIADVDDIYLYFQTYAYAGTH